MMPAKASCSSYPLHCVQTWFPPLLLQWSSRTSLENCTSTKALSSRSDYSSHCLQMLQEPRREEPELVHNRFYSHYLCPFAYYLMNQWLSLLSDPLAYATRFHNSYVAMMLISLCLGILYFIWQSQPHQMDISKNHLLY